MHCPKCLSGEFRKNGIVRGKQRFLCKSCNFNYCLFDGRIHPDFLMKMLQFIITNKGNMEYSVDSYGRKIANEKLLYILSKLFGVDIKVIKSIEMIEQSKISSRGFMNFSIKTSNLSDYDTLLIRFDEFVIVAANRYDPRLAAIFDTNDSDAS